MKFECCKSSTDGATGSIVCIKCKHYYHVQCLYPNDKKCVTNEVKKTWICPVCVGKQPRQQNNDNTPVRASSKSQHQDNDTISTRRGGASTVSPPTSSTPDYKLSAEMIKDIVASEVSRIRDDIKSIVREILSQELKPIRDEIENIKSSLDFFNQQFDCLTKRVDTIETEIKACKAVTLDFNELKTSLIKLETANNNSEQWSRRSNIEIYGVPEKKNENLFDILRIISDRAEYKINPASDIDFITRVAPKKSDSKKIKPIIIRFLARYKKDDFLSRVRKLKLKARDIGYDTYM